MHHASIMTYDIMAYDIMTYDIMTFDVMTCDIMTYHVMTSGHISSWHHDMWCNDIWCHYIWCNDIWCHYIWCHDLWSYNIYETLSKILQFLSWGIPLRTFRILTQPLYLTKQLPFNVLIVCSKHHLQVWTSLQFHRKLAGFNPLVPITWSNF